MKRPYKNRYATMRPTKPVEGDMSKFVVRIISEHKRPARPGFRRVMALCKIFGVNKTMHINVPKDFTV